MQESSYVKCVLNKLALKDPTSFCTCVYASKLQKLTAEISRNKLLLQTTTPSWDVVEYDFDCPYENDLLHGYYQVMLKEEHDLYFVGRLHISGTYFHRPLGLKEGLELLIKNYFSQNVLSIQECRDQPLPYGQFSYKTYFSTFRPSDELFGRVFSDGKC